MKLPFHFVGDGGSLRKWLLQKLLTRYTYIFTHLHIHQCEYFLFIARVLVNHLSQLRLGKNLLKSSGIH